MSRKRSRTTAYIIMSAMAIIFILPLLWVIFASFNPDAGVGLKLPSTWVMENYRYLESWKRERAAAESGEPADEQAPGCE